MGLKPTKIPIWNTGGANNVEPSGAKKILGWLIGEDPASSFFNFLMKLTGDWLTWLDDRVADAGGVAPRIGLRGIGSTGEAGGTGGDFAGNGAAAGAAGTGGATSGPGVTGAGGAPNGKGGTFTGTGTGSGLDAIGGATGYGAVLSADTTSPARSALRLVPQDANPTIPLQGDLYYNSVAKKLRAYDGASWISLSESFVTIGDGVTSFGDFNGLDQAPFIAAIASLPTGGAILVKRGTYTFTAGLVISTAKILLFGEMRELTILTSSLAAGITVQVTAADVEIRNLTIRQTQGPSANIALEINGTTGALVTNCHLDHTYAGTNVDTAPYAVVRIINAQRNTLIANVISFVPSILVAGLVDRFGVKLEALSSSAARGDCLQNQIVNNVFVVTPNGATAPTSNTALVGLISSNSSTGGTFVNRNIVRGNVVAGVLGNNTTVSFYGFLLRCTRTGTGNINVAENVIQGHALVANVGEGGGLQSFAFRLENGLGGSISDNCITGNIIPSGAAFSYAGAAPPVNNDNSLEIAHLFVGSSLNAPTTDRALTDSDLNKVP